MTQTPPLDLEAVQHRYDAVEAGWVGYPLETGETEVEYRERVEPLLSVDAYNSASDVPALLDEVRRLQHLLHRALDVTERHAPEVAWDQHIAEKHPDADADEPTSSWAYHVREDHDFSDLGTITYEKWGPG